MRHLIFSAPLVLTMAAFAWGDEFPAPDFNDEGEAMRSISEFYERIRESAVSPAAQGYAVLCAVALADLNDRIAIHGAAPKEQLQSAWRTCSATYEKIISLS
ncbi:MAG: hypothetical protein ACE5KL_03780 [Alphaproteobacteria bacterium]